jgi:LytR cell envelope-related transcriptional attenuator
VEHVQPFDRPFPWRAALAAFALTVVGILVLVAVAAGRLVHGHAAAAQATARVRQHAAAPSRPLRPRSRISVLVLNGNGASGVAGATASRLLGRGYRSATATNAPSTGYATSLVLYRRGWGPEARRLAREAGIRIVSPLDGRLPAGSGTDQIAVILGAN